MLYASNKYDLEIREDDCVKNVQRLTNQLWKLIPMREHEEDWQKQLDTVILEIVGLDELFIGPSFIQLLSKLEGLADYLGVERSAMSAEISKLKKDGIIDCQKSRFCLL